MGPIPREVIPTVEAGTPTGVTWATLRGTVIGGTALRCGVLMGMIGGAILGGVTPTPRVDPGTKGGRGIGGTAGGVLWSIFVVTPPEIKDNKITTSETNCTNNKQLIHSKKSIHEFKTCKHTHSLLMGKGTKHETPFLHTQH
jgi:hypothetical protein